MIDGAKSWFGGRSEGFVQIKSTGRGTNPKQEKGHLFLV